MLNCTLIRYHKGCWFILTAGRWSWKSKPANECVATHLPNGLAPKMDGAQAWALRRASVGSDSILLLFPHAFDVTRRRSTPCLELPAPALLSRSIEMAAAFTMQQRVQLLTSAILNAGGGEPSLPRTVDESHVKELEDTLARLLREEDRGSQQLDALPSFEEGLPLSKKAGGRERARQRMRGVVGRRFALPAPSGQKLEGPRRSRRRTRRGKGHRASVRHDVDLSASGAPREKGPKGKVLVDASTQEHCGDLSHRETQIS